MPKILPHHQDWRLLVKKEPPFPAIESLLPDLNQSSCGYLPTLRSALLRLILAAGSAAYNGDSLSGHLMSLGFSPDNVSALDELSGKDYGGLIAWASSELERFDRLYGEFLYSTGGTRGDR